MTNDTLPSGLIWHLECMELSAGAIRSFQAPSDSFQMRMHYSLFITNLMSMIDLLADKRGNGVIAEFEAEMDMGEHSGADVLAYIRELRNGIVHRGIDPQAGGIEIEGCVYAVALSVTNRSGSVTRAAPAPLLWQICQQAREGAKRVVLRHLTPHLEEPPALTLEGVHEALESVAHIPEWVKDGVRSNLTTDMLALAHASQTEKLSRLLSSDIA